MIVTDPLLVISPLYCPIHENTPGPVASTSTRCKPGGSASSPPETPPNAPRAS